MGTTACKRAKKQYFDKHGKHPHILKYLNIVEVAITYFIVYVVFGIRDDISLRSGLCADVASHVYFVRKYLSLCSTFFVLFTQTVFQGKRGLLSKSNYLSS